MLLYPLTYAARMTAVDTARAVVTFEHIAAEAEACGKPTLSLECYKLQSDYLHIWAYSV